jgi:outer membrane receptor protein involved in Fe transport
MIRLLTHLFIFFTTLSFVIAQQIEDDSIKSKRTDSLAGVSYGIFPRTIHGTELPIVPTFSLDQALVGKVAGAFITSANGTPGSSANIQLRGVNTLGYYYNSPEFLADPGTLPLVLVDGVQLRQTRLSSLDPGIIERVEIIHGPAAGALFGYQGANGVIQVFTKKGNRGKVSIDVSLYVSVNSVINNSRLSKIPYHSFPTDASGNLLDTNGNILTLDPSTLTFSGSIRQVLTDPNNQLTKTYQGNFHYVDHFNQFYKTAIGTTNSISLSGGGKKTDFLFSLSNNKLENTFANDGYNSRTNLALNLGVALTKKLSVRSVT